MVDCERHKWHCAGWYSGAPIPFPEIFASPYQGGYTTDKSKSIVPETTPPYIYCEVCGMSPQWYQDFLWREICGNVFT